MYLFAFRLLALLACATIAFCMGSPTQSFAIEMVGGVPRPLVTASGPSLQAQLNQPYGLAFTSDGLLIADASNYVMRLYQKGKISTPIGSGYLSNPTSNPSNASTSSIGSPAGVAVDRRSGSIYFCDKWYQTIRKVDANGTLTTFAGSGAAGYAGDGGLATEARVYNPKGLAVDRFGNVFIADSPNHLVRAVLVNGTIIRVAGSFDKNCGNDYDYYGNSGDTNACNRGYAGDGGLANNALLNTPTGIAFDSLGNLLISDSLNHVIRKVTSPLNSGPGGGAKITTIVGTGVAGHSGDGGPAVNALLNEPYGIAIDSRDNIFIAERGGHIVRRVSANGVISTFAGTPGVSGARGDGGPATSARLKAPRYVAVDDQSGDVFVSDTGNNAVRRVISSDRTITQITRLFSAPNSNRERADNFILLFPKSAATDASGNVFVTDVNLNGIFQVTASTGVMARIAGFQNNNAASGDGGPASLASVGQPTTTVINSIGDLFFIDQTNNIVRCIFASNGTIATLAGTGKRGNSGDGPATNVSLNLDTGLALDETSGSLYISDTLNHVVRRLDLSTGLIKIVVGVLNGPGFFGDGGPALNATLNFPFDLAFVPSSAIGGSRLYILDGQNRRIRAFWIGNGTLTTAAGNGTSLYPGEGATAIGSSLDPYALTASPEGDLFIGSPGRIMSLPATSSRLYTIAGDGVPGFSGNGGDALIGRINLPNGLSFDSATGSILLVDKGSRVVRRIFPSRNPPPPPSYRAPPLPATTQRPRSSSGKSVASVSTDGLVDEPPEVTDLMVARRLYSRTVLLALTIVIGTILMIGVLGLVVLGVIATLKHDHDKLVHRVHDIKIDCLVGTVASVVRMADESLTVAIEMDWNALVQAGDTICCFDEDFQASADEIAEANENGVPIIRHQVRKMIVRKIERIDREPDEDDHPSGTHQLVITPPPRPFSWARSIQALLFNSRADSDDLELPQVHREWMGDATKTGAAIWKLPDTMIATTTKAVQAGTISFINPRLLMFKFRGLLALSVFCLYVVGLAFVAMVLQANSCEKVCTTNFVQFVQVGDDAVCNSIFLSDPIPGFDLSVPGLRSEVNLGKCSLLHSQTCANEDWQELMQCYRSFTDFIVANARYLQLNDWESFGPEAFRVYQMYNPSFNCSIDTTIAYDGDCGIFASTGNVCWVFEVSTNNAIQSGNGNCKTSRSKRRCANSFVRAIVFESQAVEDEEPVTCSSEKFGKLVVPPLKSTGGDLTRAFNISDGTLCGGDISAPNIGASCLVVRYLTCQYVDGDAHFCLESTSSASDAEFSFPGLLFGPMVLSDVTSGFFRDTVTQTCSPWPLQLPLDTNGGSIFLFPLIERLFGHLNKNFNTTQFSSFILNSTIKVAYAANDGTPRVDIGPSALGAFWARNLIYCCRDLCQPIASAVGEAFGYVDKFETIFIMLVIAGYLLLFREEARRLRLAFSHVFDFALGDKAEAKGGGASNGPSRTNSLSMATRARSVARSKRSAARMHPSSMKTSQIALTMQLTSLRAASSTELGEVDKRRLAIMEEKIEAAVLEIKELMHEIKAVEREQASARSSGNQDEVSRLAAKESQIREKESQMREDLLEDKRMLRVERDRAHAAAIAAAMTSDPSTGSHSELKAALRSPSSHVAIGRISGPGGSSSSRLSKSVTPKLSGRASRLGSGLGLGQISAHRRPPSLVLDPTEYPPEEGEDNTNLPLPSPSLLRMRPASKGRFLPSIPSLSRHKDIHPEGENRLSPAYEGEREASITALGLRPTGLDSELTGSDSK